MQEQCHRVARLSLVVGVDSDADLASDKLVPQQRQTGCGRRHATSRGTECR